MVLEVLGVGVVVWAAGAAFIGQKSLSIFQQNTPNKYTPYVFAYSLGALWPAMIVTGLFENRRHLAPHIKRLFGKRQVTFTILIEPWPYSDESNRFVAKCPACPTLWQYGTTHEEARDNLTVASVKRASPSINSDPTAVHMAKNEEPLELPWTTVEPTEESSPPASSPI